MVKKSTGKKKHTTKHHPSYNQRVLQHIKRIKSKHEEPFKIISVTPTSTPGNMNGKYDFKSDKTLPLHPFKPRKFAPGPIVIGSGMIQTMRGGKILHRKLRNHRMTGGNGWDDFKYGVNEGLSFVTGLLDKAKPFIELAAL